MKRAVLIKPGALTEPYVVDTLEDMQRAVGGLIQVVSTNHPPNLSFFCNEEPWTLDEELNQLNELANDICSYGFEPARYEIVGPVLVMGGVVNGETQGLTAEQSAIFLSPDGETMLNALISNY